MSKIFVLGDVHFGFHCEKTFKKIFAAIKNEQPDHIVQIGDLYDFFSQSRFSKKPGIIHPNEEIEEAYYLAVDFWQLIQKMAPRAKNHQILGNHCIRPLKLTLEKCPELYHLVEKSWKELFKFKGVNTLYDTRDDLEIDEIIFEHGAYSKPGQHLRENMMNTVIGHTHRGYTHFESIRNNMLWELNVGYCADPTHPALQYTRKKWSKWTHGYGLIDELGPRFIPIF